MILALTILSAAAAIAAPATNKTMASDDWQTMTVRGVSVEPGRYDTYLQVSTGDVDGDGISDQGVIKMVCSKGAAPVTLWRSDSPRDAATGLATGKRQHGSVIFTKEWSTPSAAVSAVKYNWDLKSNTGKRMASPSGDGWTPISLSNGQAMCSALHGEITMTK